MMKLILKYRNKIVSLGLLPIIATLICLHFFQNTIVLGIGFIVCLGLLLYGIVRLKDLNFFLLLGSIGIGSCFVLRLFTGYKFIPYGSITPILELLLSSNTLMVTSSPTSFRSSPNLLRSMARTAASEKLFLFCSGSKNHCNTFITASYYPAFCRPYRTSVFGRGFFLPDVRHTGYYLCAVPGHQCSRNPSRTSGKLPL